MAPTPQANMFGEGASGVSPTASKPAGTTNGDLLIAQLSTRNATPPTHSGDAGWTEIANQTSGDATCSWWYKVANSEGASYTFGLSGSSRWILHIFRISGADPTTPIDVWGTAANLTCPAVTTTVADCLLLRGAGQLGGSTQTRTAPEGLSEQWNNNEGGSSGHWQGMATGEQAAAGSTGTAVWGTTGGASSVSATIAIAPATVAGIVYTQLERGTRGLNRGMG
jgi:hypothetical protein